MAKSTPPYHGENTKILCDDESMISQYIIGRIYISNVMKKYAIISIGDILLIYIYE